MKIDRILGIIIYLFNHDKVSAKTLAEKYDVSVRTIQRDMVNIASCGIPIYSDNGKNGGYSILSTYKLKNTIPLSEKKVDKEFFGILVLQKRINRFKMLIKHWNKR